MRALFGFLVGDPQAPRSGRRRNGRRRAGAAPAWRWRSDRCHAGSGRRSGRRWGRGRSGCAARRRAAAGASRRRALGRGSRRPAPACRDGAGRSKTSARRAALDDLAEVHHQHAIAQQPHDVEVVADEQIAHAELALELGQQLQDHDLHRDVERRGRLVEDQESGSTAMARAMPTRARWPPESWCGKRVSSSRGRPTSVAASSTRSRERGAATCQQPPQRIGDRVDRREARVEAVARRPGTPSGLRAPVVDGREARAPARWRCPRRRSGCCPRSDRAAERAGAPAWTCRSRIRRPARRVSPRADREGHIVDRVEQRSLRPPDAERGGALRAGKSLRSRSMSSSAGMAAS